MGRNLGQPEPGPAKFQGTAAMFCYGARSPFVYRNKTRLCLLKTNEHNETRVWGYIVKTLNLDKHTCVLVFILRCLYVCV